MPIEPNPSNDNAGPPGGGARRESSQGGPGRAGNSDGESEARHTGLSGYDALLTQVQRLESELRDLAGQLEQSRRLATLGSVAAGVAHELNNALTPMTSYAQLALDSPEDAGLTRKALESVVDGVARAARLNEAALGLVRDDSAASAGGPDDAGADCDLRDAVASALDCLVGQPGQGRVRVESSVPAIRVGMPRSDLQQVVVNLLLNAYRAVSQGRGGGRVTVGAQRIDASAATGTGTALAELWVADTGPGVPSAVRDTLFEPFVTRPIEQQGGRGDVGATNDGDAATSVGTGLGLSICRDLVKRSGGTISFDPPGNSGAVFRVRLRLIE